MLKDTKPVFVLDWEQRTIRCPSGAVQPLVPGQTVHYPADAEREVA